MKQDTKNSKTPALYEMIGLFAILLVTLMVYSNSVENEVLNFDDNQYFEDFPEIRELTVENIGKYFTQHYVLMYHPLPILSFAINYSFSGTNPGPLHGVNQFFHLINILLVFFLLKRLLGRWQVALGLAALWAVHPMNTEAVSWISARSSVMYACFFLAGLLTYLKYQEKRELKFYLLTLLFCLLSLLSKANAVTFPVVLLLLEWYKLRKDVVKQIVTILPFFALAILFGIIALKDGGTQNNMELTTSRFKGWEFLVMASYSIWFYLKSFLYPTDLCAIHTYPEKVDGSLPMEYYLSVAILVAALVVVIRLRKNALLLLGVMMFLGIVSLTLQIIPSRLFLMADRYVYLPYVGLMLVLGNIYMLYLKNLSTEMINAAYVLVVAYVLLASVASYDRNRAWKNTFTLVNDIIEKNPDVPYLARAYGIRAGLRETKRVNPKLILDDYSKSLELRPGNGISLHNRGWFYYRNGNYKNAEKDLKASLNDLDSSLHFQVYNRIGLSQFGLKKYKQALVSYGKSIEVNPQFPDVYNNRGVIYATQKKWDASITDFTTAIELNKRFADAFKNRGLAYINLNDRERACADLLTVKRLGSNVANKLIAANACQ